MQMSEKDKIIQKKEQQLSQMMLEYYTFDMQELKDEIEGILQRESGKISEEKEQKLQ